MVALEQVIDSLNARHHPRDTSERWLSCLLGLGDTETRRILRNAFARSDEVRELLENGEETLASIPRNTVQGEAEQSSSLNGAVSWGATAAISGQAISTNPTFVIRPIDHTRQGPIADLLVTSLREVSNAGLLARRSGVMLDPVVRERSRAAKRLLSAPENRALAGASPNRRTRADARRVRHPLGAFALRVDARRREPVSGAVLAPDLDRVTRQQLRLLHLVLELARVHDPLLVDEMALVAGPIRYVHPRNHGARNQVRGISVRNVLLDAPEPDQTRGEAWAALQRRAAGAPCRLVTNGEEVAAALSDIFARDQRADAAPPMERRSPTPVTPPPPIAGRPNAPAVPTSAGAAEPR
ncbi:MAG: hypothetical protein KDB24_01410 [Microthrixaceae bacterium]|nr:hypothetical protein [Microthrixaceae bacterium]